MALSSLVKGVLKRKVRWVAQLLSQKIYPPILHKEIHFYL